MHIAFHQENWNSQNVKHLKYLSICILLFSITVFFSCTFLFLLFKYYFHLFPKLSVLEFLQDRDCNLKISSLLIEKKNILPKVWYLFTCWEKLLEYAWNPSTFLQGAAAWFKSYTSLLNHVPFSSFFDLK